MGKNVGLCLYIWIDSCLFVWDSSVCIPVVYFNKQINAVHWLKSPFSGPLYTILVRELVCFVYILGINTS